jgi:hypothetical protein
LLHYMLDDNKRMSLGYFYRSFLIKVAMSSLCFCGR